MKVALIIPGTVWFAPFVKIYTSFLEGRGIVYSIISWNRDGGDPSYEFQYNTPAKNGHGRATFREYVKYFHYVRKVLKNNRFDRIIAFCPQTACMLADLLVTKYKGKFMTDYRDLSIEQRIGFKQIYSFVLKRSSLNVVSSPGFLKCLPKGNYVISHNVDFSLVKTKLNCEDDSKSFFLNNGNVDILTIGGIRDYSSNVQIIDRLANMQGFSIRFVGKGNAAVPLKEHALNIHAKNITFHGYYPKEEEEKYVQDATFLNIYYPRIITHDTALSNRFYNSLLYKKPMIVTKNTTQGDFAESYKVGVAIEDCEELEGKIQEFLKSDYKEYKERCNKLLYSFMRDYSVFEDALTRFLLF